MRSRLVKNKFDKFILRYNSVDNIFCTAVLFPIVNNIGNMLLYVFVTYVLFLCFLYRYGE